MGPADRCIGISWPAGCRWVWWGPLSRKKSFWPQGSGALVCEVASEQVGHHRAKVRTVGLLSDLGGLDGEQAQHTSLGGLGRATPIPPPPKPSNKGLASGTTLTTVPPGLRFSAGVLRASPTVSSCVSTDVRRGEASLWWLCFEWIWLQQAKSAETDLPGSTRLQDGLLLARQLQI